VFGADHRQEWARFDCFEKDPHYHYILQADQHNLLWGYDPDINGPMLQWALAVIRDRLPNILRKAGATELAAQVESEGFDTSILAKVEQAMVEAHQRTIPGTDLVEEGRAAYVNWKKIHPQFNTVDD
jgi:hypothetical protein